MPGAGFTRANRWDERGSAAVELVIIAPVLILMLLFVVFLGRLGWARGEVDAAAKAGARSGSLARSPGAAEPAGSRAATDALASSKLLCERMTVVMDTSHYMIAGAPVLVQPGSFVTVTVTCTVKRSDLGLPFVPGTQTITVDATEVVDEFKQVTP
jgi:Flp pilus assembly protein TadG